MMLQPTSGRRGFDYVKDRIDEKVTSFNQQDLNVAMTNTSNETNKKQQQQQQKVIQQTTNAIKKEIN